MDGDVLALLEDQDMIRRLSNIAQRRVMFNRVIYLSYPVYGYGATIGTNNSDMTLMFLAVSEMRRGLINIVR